MKKILIASLFLLFIAVPVSAETTVDLHLFYGEGCPHCAKERIFLEGLGQEYKNLRIHEYEVWYDQESQKIINFLAQESNIQSSGVPITIVGTEVLYGYDADETTGAEVRKIIDSCFTDGCPDQLGMIIADMRSRGELPPLPEETAEPIITDNASGTESATETEIVSTVSIPEKIKLPLIGEITVRDLSLPTLTFALGLVDGFNPCAMWVLVFLISLLLGIPSVKRRWLIGAVFVLVSGLVYFLFLAAWLNIFLFIGFLFWVRIAIGIIAVAAGIHFLREYWTNPEGACKVTASPGRKRILEYLKLVAQGKNLFIALGGIALIAIAVNLIELVCSAGLPAVFTQVLALNHLPGWQYYFYLLGYIFFYMLDDMVVFVLAMLTMQITGLNSKYSRFSNLIGGIVILILGVLLILRPEILTFGI